MIHNTRCDKHRWKPPSSTEPQCITCLVAEILCLREHIQSQEARIRRIEYQLEQPPKYRD